MPKRSINLSLFKIFLFTGLTCLTIFSSATTKQDAPAKLLQWKVNNVTREAMAYIPANAKSKSTSIIFVFHGHGGTMKQAMRTRALEKLWPEAIVVYPQGLNTVGQLTDPEGKRAGWQKGPGDMNNRDLLFFDVMMKSFRKDYKIDDRLIYATGHSNGGGFTYLLWATRGDQFAAFAPSAAVAGKVISKLKPKPAMHIMGENDPLVKPEWQKLMCKKVMKINGCNDKGLPYETNATIFHSKTGNPFVLYVHSGNHVYPSGADEFVIKFFKSIAKPEQTN